MRRGSFERRGRRTLFLASILLFHPLTLAASPSSQFRDALKKHGIGAEAAADIEIKINSIPSAKKTEGTLEWLAAQGVHDLGRVLRKFPQVLNASIKNALEPKVEWLKNHGVENIGKVIMNFPPILGLSIKENSPSKKDNLDSKASWLKEQGVKNIGKLIAGFPQALGYSIQDNLALKVAWLKAQGIRDIGKFLSIFPQALGYSIQNLDLKVAWLKAQGVRDIGKFLSNFPQVLGYSLEENLVPKAEFLRRRWDLDIPQIERIQPKLLGSSLTRLQTLRNGLQTLSFDVRTIDPVKRSKIAFGLRIEDVLENLRNAGIIDSDAQSASLLSEKDLEAARSVPREDFIFFLKKPLKMKPMRKRANSCEEQLLPERMQSAA